MHLWVIVGFCYLFTAVVGNDLYIETQSCGGVLNKTSGTLSIPEEYKAGDNCTWVFELKNVYLAVNTFSISQQDKVVFKMSNGTEIATLTGRKDPFLVVIPEPNATIEYVSANLTKPDLSVTYSQKDCLLNINAQTSTLRAPIYPIYKNASAALTCTYNLHVPDNRSRIALSFTALSFNKSTLGVMDLSPPFQIIFLNGSDQHPGDVLSTGPAMQLELTLKTDRPNSFLAAFSASTQGCTAVINLEDDPYKDRPQILSPNYPYYYENNLDCRMIIRSKQGSTMRVGFLDLDLAPETDVLIFHDGDSRSSSVLAKFQQGSSSAGVYLTSSNVLWVRFITDESESGRGFKLSITVQEYGGALTGGGVLDFPDVNGTIPDQVFYQLYVPEKRQVYFKINETRMLPLSLIQCYDGLQTSAPLLASISTTDIYKGVPVVATGNQMLVVAKNFSKSQQYLNAQFHAVNTGLFHSLTTPSGSVDFTSGNWLGEEISWTIVPRDEDGMTSLRFTDFSLPEGSIVQVYKGVAKHTLLVNFSSAVTFVPALNALARAGMGIYLSSVQPNSSDFANNVTFKNVQISASYSSNKSCGGKFDSGSGLVLTPGYPGFYPFNAKCGWRLVNKNKLLHVAFSDFQLSDLHTLNVYTVEYVPVNHTVGNSTVWENETVATLVAAYKGKTIPSDVITSSPEVWLNFSSQSLNHVDVAKGFQAKFESIECGGNITNYKDVATPNYPHPLTSDVTCAWVVTIPPRPSNGSASVNIIRFSYVLKQYVNTTENTLVIRDGDSDMSSVIDLNLKEGQSSQILTRMNKLWIEYKYKHDKKKSPKGFAFKLNYINFECDKSHQCANGMCLHKDWLCNGVDNCGDGTDEKNCVVSKSVSTGVTVAAMVLGCIGLFILGIIVALSAPAIYKRIKYPHYRELRDLMVPAPT